MKKIIASAIFALTAIISFAQVNSESSTHLIFKGVPIDGTLEEYTLKMEKNGFMHLTAQDGSAILIGDFASYRDCIVRVGTLKQKDLVSKITVEFPGLDTWSSLSSNYFSLKEMLTEKYGEPSDHMEKFGEREPRDDNSRMYEVKLDRCKYYATYKTAKGTIQLSIEHDGVNKCFVQLVYQDKINSDIIKAKAKDDL
jgi:hypothetical protein